MRKYITSGLLILLCISASTYIVIESAGYYQRLYVLVGLPGIMGLYTAILSEAFQLTLVILLPTNRTQKYILFLLISLIYLITVFAAGMNVGKPLIAQWSQSSNQDQLLEVLLEEKKVIGSQVEILSIQKQKVNTVLSMKAERESFKEIKNHLKNTTSIDSTLIQIELIALWLLRILIQLANLFCGRLLALKWKETKPDTPAKAKAIRKWKAKYSRKESGFVGIMELDTGYFIAISPEGKRKYKTFQGALGFFNGGMYEGKIPDTPT